MLYNPFRRLSVEVLEKWMTETPFVAAQHFRRAFHYYSPSNKTGLLLTPYKYRPEAERHVRALADQRYAAVICLQYPNHLSAVKNMLLPTVDYILFDGTTAHLIERLKQAVPTFHPKLRAYLNREVDSTSVTPFTGQPRLEIHYGEIYLLMGEGYDPFKIKLETIENT